MSFSVNQDLFLEVGSFILSLIGGIFFSYFLRKKVSLKLKKLHKVLADSKVGFFLGFFALEILFLPILSFTFQVGVALTQMVLFATGVLLITRVVRIFSKELGGYIFSHL